MTTINKLDKTFGPVGSSAGFVLIIVGIITLFTSLFGIVLLLPGIFLAFTHTSAILDFENRRVKFSENLFGIIKTGKWIPLEPEMKIGIKKSNILWQAHSQSNRSIAIENNDFRLVLLDPENNEIMPLTKTDSLDSGLLEQETLSAKLNIEKFS